MLHNNVFVEGGIIKGIVKIRIRPRRSAKESAVSISDGKLRIIGFEATESDHHEFFQFSAPLSAVVTSPLSMYCNSPADSEGFSTAREGVHQLEFEMHLPIQGARPKGPLHSQAGVAVRYIALVYVLSPMKEICVSMTIMKVYQSQRPIRQTEHSSFLP